MANESHNRVEQLEADLRKEDENVASLDADIKKCKKEIEALQSKMEEVERTKTELHKASQQQLDAEVSIGVLHLENVNNLDAEIEGFTSTISHAGRRLAVAKIQYENSRSFSSFKTCISIFYVKSFFLSFG